MPKPAIALHHVSKAFSQTNKSWRTGFSSTGKPITKQVIKDVSLTVQPKTTLGLYGPNGSGKSTLLRLIAGILHPDQGEVVVKGKVAAVIELGAGFNPELTGRENYYLYTTLLGMTDAQTKAIFPKALSFSGLQSDIDLPMKQYSSGMRARLAFSAAAFSDADILLFDEVFAVGDREFLDKSNVLMKQLKKKKTILLSSHNTALLHGFCDEVVKLEEGSLVKKNQLFEFFLDLPEEEEFITKISSNSMYPLLKKNDTVRVIKKPFHTLKTGDIIAVWVESLREVVVHRLIKSNTSSKSRKKEFFSKGDSNFEPDAWSINEENYIGVVEKTGG